MHAPAVYGHGYISRVAAANRQGVRLPNGNESIQSNDSLNHCFSSKQKQIESSTLLCSSYIFSSSNILFD